MIEREFKLRDLPGFEAFWRRRKQGTSLTKSDLIEPIPIFYGRVDGQDRCISGIKNIAQQNLYILVQKIRGFLHFEIAEMDVGGIGLLLWTKRQAR